MYIQHIFRLHDVCTDVTPCAVSLGKYEILFEQSMRGEKKVCLCTVTEQCECSAELAHALQADTISDHVEPLDSIAKDARKEVDRLVRLIRWKGQLRGKAQPALASEGMSWSADKVAWKKIRRELTVGIRFGLPFGSWRCAYASWGAEAPSTLTEPLAHEILREVRDEPERSPRSSVMVAMSAAECGMQQLIERKFGAESIRDNPPLSTLLRTFVPRLDGVLRVNERPLAFPRTVIEKIERGKDLRDQLVHRRAPSPSDQEVKDVIEAVSDFLYLLDIYSGQYWAAGHLSHATRVALQAATTSSSANDSKNSAGS